MKDKSGQYLVMWHIVRAFKKPGLVNQLFGKRQQQLMPVIQGYNTEKFAKMRYDQIKTKGGLRPYLLRVIET
ncbi:MAG: hypothetical protein ABIB71_09485 [Candidatus Woesearchaeota archaeon]